MLALGKPLAQTIGRRRRLVNRARDFPNTRTSELPVSPEGDRAINGTPPFWQRYLPFWASNLVERMCWCPAACWC